MTNRVIPLFRRSDTINLKDDVHRSTFYSSYHAAARPLLSRFICQNHCFSVLSKSTKNVVILDVVHCSIPGPTFDVFIVPVGSRNRALRSI